MTSSASFLMGAGGIYSKGISSLLLNGTKPTFGPKSQFQATLRACQFAIASWQLEYGTLNPPFSLFKNED